MPGLSKKVTDYGFGINPFKYTVMHSIYTQTTVHPIFRINGLI